MLRLSLERTYGLATDSERMTRPRFVRFAAWLANQRRRGRDGDTAYTQLIAGEYNGEIVGVGDTVPGGESAPAPPPA